jgi:hypothetical protein
MVGDFDTCAQAVDRQVSCVCSMQQAETSCRACL